MDSTNEIFKDVANQMSPDASPLQPLDISPGADAALSHDDTFRRDAVKQPQHMVEVGCHRAEVAVIDADERGPQIEHALEVLGIVEFDQRSHAQVKDFPREAAEMAVIQAFSDQQDSVGPVGGQQQTPFAAPAAALPGGRPQDR